jgi:hypothetical protein
MTSRFFTPTRTLLGATVVVLAIFGLIWALGSHRAAAETGTLAEAHAHEKGAHHHSRGHHAHHHGGVKAHGDGESCDHQAGGHDHGGTADHASHDHASHDGEVGDHATHDHGTHQDEGDGVTFTGTREETARLIAHYHAIELSPEQERLKTEALEAIPAPCCDDNSLATCCCPCNLAKASWGLAAWLITEQGYGAEEIRQATRDWLAAANPNGFAGNACYTPGGCARPMHQDGCGGMDDRRVL